MKGLKVGVWVLVAVGSMARVGFGDETGKALSERMIKAYQGVKTYRAVWHLTGMEEADRRTVLEVVFERATKRVTVKMQEQALKGKEWVSGGNAILLVNDGKKLHRSILMEGKWETDSKDTPKDFSYRDVRRGLIAVPLVDLPLLLSEKPLEELVAGEVGEVMEVAADPKDEKKRAGLKVKDSIGETEITLRLDLKTHLVQESVYGPAKYVVSELSVDKEVAKEVFDFESVLKGVKAGK
jgi:hypothetical protein